MPVSTFGVTAATIQAECFPQITLDASSRPTSTAVANIVTRVGAQVSGLITALGIAPDGLDATNEPISYYACQRLVTAGAAMQVAHARVGKVPDGEVVSGWRREWEDGIKALSDPWTAQALLPDALGSSSPTRMQTHIGLIGSGSIQRRTGDVEIEDPAFRRSDDL